MQYTAEVTHPTPEGTSNGLIQLFGQASVVFVYIMAALQTPNGSFTPALLLAIGLLIISVDCYADERHANQNDDKRISPQIQKSDKMPELSSR